MTRRREISTKPTEDSWNETKNISRENYKILAIRKETVELLAIPGARGQIQEPRYPLSIDLNQPQKRMDDPKSYSWSLLVRRYVLMVLLINDEEEDGYQMSD